MAMKLLGIIVVMTGLVTGCGRPATPPPEEELDGSSVTRWTAKTELFAEYAPLVVGKVSRFAIHLTRLDSFKAITEGRVEVQLRGGAGPPELFRVDGPSRPGIFGVDVRPTHPGARELVIRLASTGLDDEHRAGAVHVYPDAAAARAAASGQGKEEPGISFLKEQQWALDFATAVVQERPVRESIRVPAQIVARPGGDADVVAPVDGRLIRVVDVALGANVSRGQELGRLLPPPATPGELPQLQHARADATIGLDLARRDRERAERLVTAGAAPQKRLDEAQATEAQAAARVRAADAQLAQYNAARTADGTVGQEGLFVIRAPLAGVIAHRAATTGANVTAGAVLFRIVDPAQVHVVGQVPEADAARARLVKGGEIQVPGRDETVSAGRLASIGRVLDLQSRTLPVIFALDNSVFRLPVGQGVSLHLLLGETPSRPVVPAAAIVDDAGRPIVFVQREGESFERRPVTLGARSGDVVQVIDGVKTGERVVTKGAYLVRLASLSTQVPAHGHVH